jgi:hypothetical protein
VYPVLTAFNPAFPGQLSRLSWLRTRKAAEVL